MRGHTTIGTRVAFFSWDMAASGRSIEQFMPKEPKVWEVTMTRGGDLKTRYQVPVVAETETIDLRKVVLASAFKDWVTATSLEPDLSITKVARARRPAPFSPRAPRKFFSSTFLSRVSRWRLAITLGKSLTQPSLQFSLLFGLPVF